MQERFEYQSSIILNTRTILSNPVVQIPAEKSCFVCFSQQQLSASTAPYFKDLTQLQSHVMCTTESKALSKGNSLSVKTCPKRTYDFSLSQSSVKCRLLLKDFSDPGNIQPNSDDIITLGIHIRLHVKDKKDV